MYVDTYIHVTTANVKRSHEYEREKGEVYRKLGGRKEKGEMMQFYSNLKNKRKNKNKEKRKEKMK